jgi:hypothetical protein
MYVPEPFPIDFPFPVGLSLKSIVSNASDEVSLSTIASLCKKKKVEPLRDIIDEARNNDGLSSFFGGNMLVM